MGNDEKRVINAMIAAALCGVAVAGGDDDARRASRPQGRAVGGDGGDPELLAHAPLAHGVRWSLVAAGQHQHAVALHRLEATKGLRGGSPTRPP